MQQAYNRNKNLKANRKVVQANLQTKNMTVLNVRKYVSWQHGFQLNISAVRALETESVRT